MDALWAILEALSANRKNTPNPKVYFSGLPSLKKRCMCVTDFMSLLLATNWILNIFSYQSPLILWLEIQQIVFIHHLVTKHNEQIF